MRSNEQVEKILVSYGLTKKQSKEISKKIFSEIYDCLIEKKKVVIPCVGSIILKEVRNKTIKDNIHNRLYIYSKMLKVCVKPSLQLKKDIKTLNEYS